MNMSLLGRVVSCCAVGLLAAQAFAAEPGPLDRTILPIQEPARPLYKEVDARNVKMPPRFEVKAPEGAPNVVIVLIDDMGFGVPTAFGGPVSMPTLDALAQQGLRYNNFHTTALCSPTRAALKSGRNHHTVNMAFITEMATGLPGATGQIPNATAPLAETLRLNGYATAAFGKWHETAAWEASVAGPFDRWPTHQGFDKFYGFLGGETNQWAPFLYDGTAVVELPDDPNYHFMTDMTDKAVAWIKYQKALAPQKPSFIYFAQARRMRRTTCRRNGLRAGKASLTRAGTRCARKRSPGRSRWASSRRAPSSHQSRLRSGTGIRFPPTRSASSRARPRCSPHTRSTPITRSAACSRRSTRGQADNTLVVYIAGDNGTSGEGGANGMFNEYTYFNGVQETVAQMLPKIEKWGGPETYPHMASGWAVGFDSPFGWMKQVPSDFGGTRNGMVMSWPKGIKAKNSIRTQFSHVIDVAPTILQAIGLPEPKVVNSTPQIPMEGTSLLYTFDDPKAKERHTTQYFEIAGNRAIYHDGWFARTIHRAPWEAKPRRTLEDNSAWQLYDTRSDFSLANDLASKNPRKLAELQAVFLHEAEKHHVLPMDDRVFERMDGAAVGRPDLMAGRNSMTLAEGMTGMMEGVFINVKNRSKTITAEVDVPQGGANGTVIAQGGRFGGWSLYVKDGVPAYGYNFLGMQQSNIVASKPLAPGRSTVKFDFAYDGGGPGKGGLGTLFINGEKVGEGRIEHTQAGIFSADETADIGIDLGTPVVEAVGSEARSKFNGHIPQVTIEVRK